MRVKQRQFDNQLEMLGKREGMFFVYIACAILSVSLKQIQLLMKFNMINVWQFFFNELLAIIFSFHEFVNVIVI